MPGWTDTPSQAARRLASVASSRINLNSRKEAIRFVSRAFPESYAALSMLPRLALAYRWLHRLESAGVGRRLSALPLQHYRTSDTVFVLGTGASINNYPPEWWRVIQNHNSISMNFFLLHEHIPTFHVMEAAGGIRRDLLAIRYVDRADYRDVPLILKSQLTNLSSRRVANRLDHVAALHPEVLGRTYLSADVAAVGRTVKDMEASYRVLGRLGLWNPKERFSTLTKRRGSVSYVVNLAVRAGYRRIVLCGVDLNHTEYFYDARRMELEAAGLPVPPNKEPGEVHSTNDPAKHPVTIHHVIATIKQTFLDPAGVELLVGSETSALHPDLACFDWEGASTRPAQQSRELR